MKKLLVAVLILVSFIAGAATIRIFKPRFVLLSRNAIGVERAGNFIRAKNVEVWEVEDRTTGEIFKQLVFASESGQVSYDIPVTTMYNEYGFDGE